MSDYFDFRGYDLWKTRSPGVGSGGPEHHCVAGHRTYNRDPAAPCWQCAQDEAIAAQATQDPISRYRMEVCPKGHRRLVRDPRNPGKCWACHALTKGRKAP